jgi:hypothetical protein
MGIQINDFLNAFSREAKFCLSLPVFWSVSIDGVSTGSINSVLQSAQEKWRATTSPEEMTRSGNILVAQNVTLPGEGYSNGVASFGGGSGGFLPANIMEARDHFGSRDVAVSFLETNVDLEHTFFRPWSIAVGINGFIESGPPLKATMVVKQYDNKGNLRKGFKFTKVTPAKMESLSLDYDNTTYTVKSVTFRCQNYEQL